MSHDIVLLTLITVARDITAALSFPINAVLTTDVTVQPLPSQGNIRMQSGLIYFKPGKIFTKSNIYMYMYIL